MRNIGLNIAALLLMPPDRKGGAAVMSPGPTAPAAQPDPLAACPFTIAGFKVSSTKGYDQTHDGTKNGTVIGKRMRIAQTVLSLNLKSGTAHVIGNVSITKYNDKNRKPEFSFSLPASSKAQGAFFEAVVKTDDPATTAAIEHFRTVEWPNKFKAWAKTEPAVLALVKGEVVTSRGGGMELDLDED